MSKYQEIKQQLTDRWEADDEYWKDLGRQLSNMLKAFVVELGIEPTAEAKRGVNTQRILSIGTKSAQDGKFEQQSVKDLPRSDQRLLFTIRLFFSHDLTPPRYDEFFFRMDIGKVDGLYIVRVNSGAGGLFVKEFQIPAYKQLFEHFYSEMQI